MKNINVRLLTTNGSEVYHNDFILTVSDDITADEVENFIEDYKDNNTDYQVRDVMQKLAEKFNGGYREIYFAPDFEMFV
jgi:hypothetical protein